MVDFRILEPGKAAVPFIARVILAVLASSLAAAAAAQPIRIAVDAEFGIPSSTSAQAIHNGALIAAAEINDAGGVLGRKLEIVRRDNRGVPARALNNLRELAADPNVVALLCGKYSPVAVELLPEIHRLKMPMLDPWAAANVIVDNGYSPNYVFRLSLRDSWAMRAMLQYASRRGISAVGILLPNTEWGRSNLRAAEGNPSPGNPSIVAVEWYNWGDASLVARYHSLRSAGAAAIVLVANEGEGATLVNELAALPADQLLPVVAHWGITGGQFFAMTQPALQKIDLAVVQTVSFLGRSDPATRRVLARLKTMTGSDDPRQVASPVGVAHAYDLVHLVARAIRQAATTDRAAVRNALERLGPYSGLTGQFPVPFTATRHEALNASSLFMARFAADGAIVRLPAASR